MSTSIFARFSDKKEKPQIFYKPSLVNQTVLTVAHQPRPKGPLGRALRQIAVLGKHRQTPIAVHPALIDIQEYMDQLGAIRDNPCLGMRCHRIYASDWLRGVPTFATLADDTRSSSSALYQTRLTTLVTEEALDVETVCEGWKRGDGGDFGAINVEFGSKGMLALDPRLADRVREAGYWGRPVESNSHIGPPGNSTIFHLDGYAPLVTWLCHVPGIDTDAGSIVVKYWWRWPPTRHNVQALILWEAGRERTGGPLTGESLAALISCLEGPPLYTELKPGDWLLQTPDQVHMVVTTSGPSFVTGFPLIRAGDCVDRNLQAEVDDTGVLLEFLRSSVADLGSWPAGSAVRSSANENISSDVAVSAEQGWKIGKEIQSYCARRRSLYSDAPSDVLSATQKAEEKGLYGIKGSQTIRIRDFVKEMEGLMGERVVGAHRALRLIIKNTQRRRNCKRLCGRAGQMVT